MISSLIVPTLTTAAICVLWLKVCEVLTHRKVITTRVSRKLIHIGTGIVFLFTWGLFPIHHPLSRYFAASVPAIVTFQFALIGLGVIKDPKTVNSMSRSGSPRELLLGPASYGVVFVVSAIVYWMHSPVGITALSMLFIGDGFAGLVGQEFKTNRLPYNKSKTVGGTIAFIASSILFTPLMLALTQYFGYIPLFSISAFMPSLVLVSFICGAVESIPLEDWDNITVYLTSVGTLMLLGWT